MPKLPVLCRTSDLRLSVQHPPFSLCIQVGSCSGSFPVWSRSPSPKPEVHLKTILVQWINNKQQLELVPLSWGHRLSHVPDHPAPAQGPFVLPSPLFLGLGLPRAPCTERCIPQHTLGTTHILFDLEWRPEVYCRVFVHILVLAQMFQHVPASLLALTGKKEQNQTKRQTIISQIHVHNTKAITSGCHKLYFTMKIIFSQTLLGFACVWFWYLWMKPTDWLKVQIPLHGIREVYPFLLLESWHKWKLAAG